MKNIPLRVFAFIYIYIYIYIFEGVVGPVVYICVCIGPGAQSKDIK